MDIRLIYILFALQNSFRHKLERSFIQDSRECLQEADIIGVIHDVSPSWHRDRLDIKIINLLRKYSEKPSLLFLNKVC